MAKANPLVLVFLLIAVLGIAVIVLSVLVTVIIIRDVKLPGHGAEKMTTKTAASTMALHQSTSSFPYSATSLANTTKTEIPTTASAPTNTLPSSTALASTTTESSHSTPTTEAATSTTKAEIPTTRSAPTSTLPSSTASASTTTESSTTEASTTTAITSTAKGSTSVSMESPATSTTVPVTTVMAKKNLSCLFVGDMYNFGGNQTAYDQERSFIASTSQSLFDKGEFKAGLSLYGYVEEPFPYLGLHGMESSFEIFSRSLSRMVYNEDGNGVTTERAIYKINNYTNYGEVNCLVFISAQLDTTKLPELNPTSMGSSATIVAVGFNGTDLTGIVDQRGTAVSVPYEYNATDVQNVVEAVLNT